MQPCILHKLESGPKVEATLTKEDALKYLAQMNNIRRMQLDAFTMYTEKYIRGFLHLTNGQVRILYIHVYNRYTCKYLKIKVFRFYRKTLRPKTSNFINVVKI